MHSAMHQHPNLVHGPSGKMPCAWTVSQAEAASTVLGHSSPALCACRLQQPLAAGTRRLRQLYYVLSKNFTHNCRCSLASSDAVRRPVTMVRWLQVCFTTVRPSRQQRLRALELHDLMIRGVWCLDSLKACKRLLLLQQQVLPRKRMRLKIFCGSGGWPCPASNLTVYYCGVSKAL